MRLERSEANIMTACTDSKIPDLPAAVIKEEKHDCAVCGDKSTGKHYGVSTCEGCKSFFKRTVRNSTSYTCRGNNICTVDRNNRSRCPSCRFQKCLSTGMKKEAVQTTKIPAIPGFPFPQFSDPTGFYTQGFLPFTFLQPVLSNQGNFNIGVYPQNPGTSEVVYELAAHVLFTVVDWARKLPTFNSLVESDQVTLLRMAWSDLFLLESARSPIHMYIQQLYATANMQARQISMETILKRMEHARLFQDQVEKVRTLGMDMTEHFHIKCIVLFRTDGSPIIQPQQIEVLQDTSQSSLERYIKTQYSNQPTRFGKLLLMLSSLRKVEPTVIEQLFFLEVLRGASMGDVLKKMLTGSSSAPVISGSLLA